METVTTFSHPSLGVIRGLVSETTQRFLGIRYATLSNKWSPASLNEGSNTGFTNATVIGPAVPSPPNGCDIDFALVQKALPCLPIPQSDTDCLNLNITGPKNSSSESKLPVIVYLHGGGFVIGANSWPQYDMRRMVEHSILVNQPVMAVNINYRLGAPGFLTSRELVSHGYKPNNGLHDQRIALLWIQKYVSGFGGDPSNVTLVGESAGGASATIHLESTTPLFKRMVSMGGTNLLIPPLPEIIAEQTYQRVIDRLGLSKLEPSARVKALTELSTRELLSVMSPKDPLLPTFGGEVGVRFRTYADIYEGDLEKLNLPGKEWCEDIMVGGCQMDASILSNMLPPEKQGMATAFKNSLTRSFRSADKADQVLHAYNISLDLPAHEAYENILNFAQDIKFLLPELCYAHCWSGHAYLYNFIEVNSWDGPWKGHANHILDVAYLFQNYNEHLSDSQRAVARQFATDLISFVHGKAPWAPFNHTTKEYFSRVYGGTLPGEGGKRVETVKGPAEVRTQQRTTIFTLTPTIPADELSRGWEMFMAGL
ncbi:Lipase 3 [Talaromyces pinophilus]|nr:Lipase 3 [Talaromyces pinophilus]